MLSVQAESFSPENLATLWREIFLQPLLTAALLLTSVKRPQQVEQALKLFSQNQTALPTLTAGLKVLIGLGTLYRVNKYLSKRALNNHIRDSWDWRKEIILITGGSSGIGELMVRKFAKLGIKVIAVDLKPPSKPFPVGVTFYQLDLTDAHAIREHAQKIREEVGHPTVLINNAGIGAGMSILDEPLETIRRTFDVNIIAHFHLAKEFLPQMIERDHGHVVTLASVASFITLASNVDYSCTKTAALAFHEGLTQELRHRYDAKRVRTT